MRWTKVKNDFERSPLGLSGLFVQLLKEHFRNEKLYSDDPTESKLIIELHQQWNPSNCENYPGIYIQRGGWQVLENLKTMGNYESLLNSSDRIQQWLPIGINYNIICVGKEYGEVENLLEKVWRFFVGFSEPIKDEYNLNKFSPRGISEIQLLKEDKSYRTGSFSIEVTFEYKWELIFEKGLIKDIVIKDE